VYANSQQQNHGCKKETVPLQSPRCSAGQTHDETICVGLMAADAASGNWERSAIAGWKAKPRIKQHDLIVL